MLGTVLGAVPLEPGRVLAILGVRLGLVAQPEWWSPAEAHIVLVLRLPRVVAAGLVGALLATAGVLLQGVLRNPLADPFILGISGGAALGATLGTFLAGGLVFVGITVVPLCAFAGGLLAAMLVFHLARVGAEVPVARLLLAGFATSTLAGSATAFLLTVADPLQVRLRYVFAWMLGGISVVGWQPVLVGALVLAVGGVLSVRLVPVLNAFLVGEEEAAYLGVEVEQVKRSVAALATLLTATAVTLSGLVGFVGLIVPHALRMVLGPDHRILLPAAMLAGGAFVMLLDTVARVAIAPAEMPIGIVTGLLGGPFFLLLLRRYTGRYQG